MSRLSRSRSATALTCRTDSDIPGCDTSPAGRLGFVVHEAQAAWRSRRNRTTTPSTSSTPTDDRPSAPGADGRPDLPFGGTR